MANRIKGITVEIGGDTTGLDKALKSVNSSIKHTQSALRDVNKLLDKKSKGKIRCEKLYPRLNVRIGRLTEEIISVEEACNIHMEENKILLT